MARKKKPAKPSAEESLAAEEQALQRQRAELLRRYEGEYVALRAGRVVAHGPDDEELAWRLFFDLGDWPFYIAKVERTLTVYELPSPELRQ
jgi:hypothetical protein